MILIFQFIKNRQFKNGTQDYRIPYLYLNNLLSIPNFVFENGLHIREIELALRISYFSITKLIRS